MLALLKIHKMYDRKMYFVFFSFTVHFWFYGHFFHLSNADFFYSDFKWADFKKNEFIFKY